MSYAASARFEMGRVISQTFGVIGRNAPSILLLSFGAALISTLGGYGLGWLLGRTFGSELGVILAALAGMVIGLVVQGLLASCLTLIVVSDLNGRRTDVGTALGGAVRLVGPVIALSIVVGLGVGFGFLLLVVPGVLLLVRWFVAVPVRVIEGLGTSDAMSRSAELTSGHRWPLFGLIVAYTVLTLVIGFVLGFVLGFGGSRYAGQTGIDVAGLAVQVVISTISSAIGSAGAAVIYTELRRIKEGAMPNQLAAVFE